MSSLYKRKLKTGEVWYGNVKLRNGQYRNFCTHCTSKREAREMLAGIEAEIAAGRDPFNSESGGKESVEEAVRLFLDARRLELKARVIWLHKDTLERFKKEFGDRSVRTLDTGDLTAFRSELLKGGKRRGGAVSAVTANGHMVRIGTFLKWCATNLCRDWTPPALPRKIAAKRKTEIRYYNSDEIRRLLDAAELIQYKGEPLSWFLGFLIYTGLRKGEALACEWSWVDDAANRIFVPAQKSARTRAVPISPKLREILMQLPRSRKRLFGNISNLHRGSGHLDDMYRKVQRAAGLEHLTIHDLRRTFIVHCLMAGIPMELVMNWVGHESDKTTLQYYTSFARENQAALLAQVEFGRSSTNFLPSPVST